MMEVRNERKEWEVGRQKRAEYMAGAKKRNDERKREREKRQLHMEAGRVEMKNSIFTNPYYTYTL